MNKGRARTRGVENLTDVLRAKTAAPMPQVSVITDGGNGVQHLHRLLPGKVRSILDWFHISMRVRYLEQIVAGLLQCWRPTEI